MSVINRKSIYLLLTAIILLITVPAFGSGSASSEPLLPEGLVIENTYKPGIGLPIGKILLVQGQVVVIHADGAKGFYAKNDQSLFKGDKIVTLAKGRIRIKLNDDSIITQASETKLVLNKVVYTLEKKSRSSFIGMDKGKARFLIKKLVDFKHSEFKVKTKTAVAGVRGSEFIIRATDLLTEIITLEDTKLEVLSLAIPCKDFKGFPRPPECEVKPIILTDFEKTIVMLGELPSETELVTPVDIEEMENDFTVTPDAAAPEGAGGVEPAQEGAGDAEAPAETQVVVAVEEIVEPEPLVEGPPSAPDFTPIPDQPDPGMDLLEDFAKGSLPDFPELPGLEP